MTTKLEIQRARVKTKPEDIFPITEFSDIEHFTVEIIKTKDSEETFQGRILDENSSTVLSTPEMKYDPCVEKVSGMIKSLGKVVKIDPSGKIRGLETHLKK